MVRPPLRLKAEAEGGAAGPAWVGPAAAAADTGEAAVSVELPFSWRNRDSRRNACIRFDTSRASGLLHFQVRPGPRRFISTSGGTKAILSSVQKCERPRGDQAACLGEVAGAKDAQELRSVLVHVAGRRGNEGDAAEALIQRGCVGGEDGGGPFAGDVNRGQGVSAA